MIEAAFSKHNEKEMDICLFLLILFDSGNTDLNSIMRLFEHFSSGRSVHIAKNVIVKRISDRLGKSVQIKSKDWVTGDSETPNLQLINNSSLVTNDSGSTIDAGFATA